MKVPRFRSRSFWFDAIARPAHYRLRRHVPLNCRGYVWHAALKAPTVAANLEAAGFKIRSRIIRNKQHFALSRNDYHYHSYSSNEAAP